MFRSLFDVNMLLCEEDEITVFHGRDWRATTLLRFNENLLGNTITTSGKHISVRGNHLIDKFY